MGGGIPASKWGWKLLSLDHMTWKGVTITWGGCRRTFFLGGGAMGEK